MKFRHPDVDSRNRRFGWLHLCRHHEPIDLWPVFRCREKKNGCGYFDGAVVVGRWWRGTHQMTTPTDVLLLFNAMEFISYVCTRGGTSPGKNVAIWSLRVLILNNFAMLDFNSSCFAVTGGGWLHRPLDYLGSRLFKLC